jgi:microcystin-dependent protein
MRHSILAAALVLGASQPLATQAADVYGAPNFIDYQGLVKKSDGSLYAAGSPALYKMQFRVCDEQGAGTVIWAEQQLVTVLDGKFSVRLGEGQGIPLAVGGADEGRVAHNNISGAFMGNSRYLGVTVIDPLSATNNEIVPRLAFLSAPYAYVAGTAANLVQAPGTSSNLSVGTITYSTGTVTSSVALDGSKRTNLINATSAELTATLPLGGANKELLIAKTDNTTNEVIIAPPAGGNINGSTASIRLKVKGESVTLQNTGGNTWWIVSEARDRTPSGTIISFGGNGPAPAGYLKCDGSTLIRADYPDLFTAIGTQWGTPNATTFNLPNTEGRFLRGVGDSPDADNDATSRFSLLAGGATGRNVGSYQTEDFRNHGHGVSDPGHSHAIVKASDGSGFADSNTPGGWGFVRRSLAGEGITADGIDAIGSGTEPDVNALPLAIKNAPSATGVTVTNSGGNETRPDNVGVRFCIKY